MSAPRENRPALAMTLAAIAFFCFALVDISAKLLVTAGYAVLMVAFARYLSNLIMVLLVFVPREGISVFRSNAVGLQILRGIALMLSTVFNFWALNYLPLTTTIPIFFAMPLVVCLLSVPMLGEHVGYRRYIAVIVGFLGVLLITRPGTVTFHWAMLISISATCGAALYFILTRMIAGRDDSPVSQIYASGVATIGLAPLAIGQLTWPSTSVDWVLLIAVGVIAGFGHTILTVAYRYQPASVLTPFVYTEIVYITAFTWLAYKQLPDGWTVLGCGLIIMTGIYVWIREGGSTHDHA